MERFIASKSLRTIGNNAFSNCKNLKLVVLNEGLEMLGVKESSYN